MNNYFITGAMGFIGSNMVKHILENDTDANIVILAKDKNAIKGHLLLETGLINHVTVVEGDIIDYNLMERVITEYEIEYIINLASLSIVRVCEDNPLYSLYANVAGSAVIFDIARKHPKVKHVITFTSDKSYGESEELPYVEDKTPLKGKRPYEATKTLVDIWAQMYQENYKTPITVVRSANVFGEGDPNMSRLIPQVAVSIAQGKNPWMWSGVAEYVREFIYVKDVCDFMWNLIQKGKENPEIIPECYNLGSGNVFSIKELVQKFIDVTESSVEIEFKEKEFDFKEIPEQYLSLEKSEKLLGWKAQYVDKNFDVALMNTFEYYKDFANVFTG